MSAISLAARFVKGVFSQKLRPGAQILTQTNERLVVEGSSEENHERVDEPTGEKTSQPMEENVNAHNAAVAAPAKPVDPSLICPECGEGPFTHRRVLGNHRHRKHGVAATSASAVSYRKQKR